MTAPSVETPRVPVAAKPKLERTALVKNLERRLFFRQGLSLGALALLTGCDISDSDEVQRVLRAMSRLNDRAQALLFNPNKMAPTYPESAVVKPFRYNAYYGADQAPKIDGATYKLEFSGLIGDKRAWSLDRLYALPQTSQITRHVCVEGWSMIGKWSGAPLRTLLERVDADMSAKYVGFICADGYYSSLDMASALHPQTILAFKCNDETLEPRYGYPFKIRIPTKLGFKNPKFITALFVTNRYSGGFWSDRGYNWFGGT